MRVIKNNEIIEDTWELLAPEQALPDSGAVLIGLGRWNALSEPAGSGLRIGVVLRSDESPSQIDRLRDVNLIAIDFPKFADGRGYSAARLLRERLKFEGELRAVGDVLRDQLFYMKRCGIDSFALKDGKDFEGALSAFRDFSVSYQGAADEARPLFRRVAR